MLCSHLLSQHEDMGAAGSESIGPSLKLQGEKFPAFGPAAVKKEHETTENK